MNTFSGGAHSNGDWRNALTKLNNFSGKENIFCTENNLKRSLDTLSEELESLGIAPVTVKNDLQTSETLKELCVKVINAKWNLIQKYRLLMQLHDHLLESNQRTGSENVSLKNQVKRLKEDIQKKERLLSETQERERRLKVQFEDASRDLKREKEETRKLQKQIQYKNSQHEHEIRRIMQSWDKEQSRRPAGTSFSRDKALQKLQADHKEELVSYKQTICRLEENNRQMLLEINNLKQDLVLHSSAIDLHIEASGAWTDTPI